MSRKDLFAQAGVHFETTRVRKLVFTFHVHSSSSSANLNIKYKKKENLKSTQIYLGHLRQLGVGNNVLLLHSTISEFRFFYPNFCVTKKTFSSAYQQKIKTFWLHMISFQLVFAANWTVLLFLDSKRICHLCISNFVQCLITCQQWLFRLINNIAIANSFVAIVIIRFFIIPVFIIVTFSQESPILGTSIKY